MPAFSTVERAFQLARSGEYETLDDLRATLAREGYVDGVAQTSFPFVRKQLRDLLSGRAASKPVKAERSRKRSVLTLSFDH